MKANWVRHTTATTGAGTITLGSAVSGFTAIADHPTLLPDGCQVRYQVQDGNNRAAYIGLYTASGTTLSIVRVVETLVAGVYDNTAPVALTLSGSAIVTIGTSANTMFDGQTKQYDSSYICFPDNIIRLDGVDAAATPNQIDYFPAFLMFARPMVSLAVHLGTADAAATDTRCGIWAPNADGRPGALLGSTGNLDLSATGVVSEALSSPLMAPPGIYLFGMKTDSAIARFSKVDIANTGIFGPIHGLAATTSKMRPLRTENHTGALASDPTIDGAGNVNSMMVFGWQS